MPLTLLTLLLGAIVGPRPADRLEIRGVAIVDVRSGRLQPNRNIVIEGERIVEVTDGSSRPAPGAAIIEGRGMVAMPGLVDMHVHVEEDDLVLMLANGITTIREMNGSARHLALRDEIAAGKRLGPTMFVSSTLIAGAPLQWRHVLATTEAEATRVAEAFADQRFDFLKVYDGLTPAAYMAVVAVGEARGIPVVGHIPKEVGLANVLNHGQSTIEHIEQLVGAAGGHQFDSAGIPGLVAQLKGKGVAVTATLAAMEILGDSRSAWFRSLFDRPEMRYTPAGVRGWWESMRRGAPQGEVSGMPGGNGAYISRFRMLTRALAEAGIPVLVGTDTPNPLLVPGFSLVHELEALERAGLDRAWILRAATLGAATQLHQEQAWGSIEPGMRADIVLTAANPLADLAALRTVQGVVIRGRWHSSASLAPELSRIAAARAPR